MKATVLDTVTGKTEIIEASHWCWSDGHWSCDCNRHEYGQEYCMTTFATMLLSAAQVQCLRELREAQDV